MERNGGVEEDEGENRENEEALPKEKFRDKHWVILLVCFILEK